MTASVLCPQCGKPIPGDAPQGLCPACLIGAALDSEATLPPSEATLPPATVPGSSDFGLVPGYEILGELGRGGMGVVYKARHLKLNRVVAVKMILAGGHAGAADLDRFRIEAEAIARLQHPSIIQVFETGDHEGKPYFALEFCPGGSLAQKLDATPLPPLEAARLVETLARAMEVAHQKGVLHRDLKPANVLLSEDGTPKITDFGLAKKMDEAGRTASGAVMGTPSYMAPEQAGGKSSAMGPATDIYALGAILYELMTGRPPFKAATSLDTILQVVSDEPVPPRRLQPRAPRDLETICLKCLRKDPVRRYVTASELAEDLRRFQAGEPILARPTGIPEKLAKWVRRRPVVAGLLATVLLATVAGITAFVWAFGQTVEARNVAEADRKQAEAARKKANEQQKKAEHEKRLAEIATRKAEENERTAEWRLYATQMNLAQAAWDAKKVHLANYYLSACRKDFRGWEHDYLYTLFNKNQQTLRGQNTYKVTSVAFSPDGKRILSRGWDHTLSVWNAETGKEIWTRMEEYARSVVSVAFSPDGKKIVSVGANRTVKVWDTETGKVIRSLPAKVKVANAVAAVAFSPDGTRMVTGQAGPEYHTLTLWDIINDKEIWTCTGHQGALTAYIYCVAYSPDGTRIVSGSADTSVKVWDAETGKEIRTLRGHKSRVVSVGFSPDSKKIVSGSWDFTLKVWDAETGKEIRTLKGNSGIITSVAFSPDGKKIVSGDWAVVVWDAESGQQCLTLEGHTKRLTSAAFSPDGKKIVSGSEDGTIKVWYPLTASVITTFNKQQAGLRVTFSPDGMPIVFNRTPDGWLKARDLESGKESQVKRRQDMRGTAVAVSQDGKKLLLSENKLLTVWDMVTGQRILTFKGPNADLINSIRTVISPGGKKFLFWGLGHRFTLWDAVTDRAVSSGGVPGHRVYSVAFSSDSTKIISGHVPLRDEDFQNLIKVWDLTTGKTIQTLHGFGACMSVAFSPDGKRIVSGSGKNLLVWDAVSGQQLLTLTGHANNVHSIAFSSDGKKIISSDPAGTIKVWDGSRSQR